MIGDDRAVVRGFVLGKIQFKPGFAKIVRRTGINLMDGEIIPGYDCTDFAIDRREVFTEDQSHAASQRLHFNRFGASPEVWLPTVGDSLVPQHEISNSLLWLN